MSQGGDIATSSERVVPPNTGFGTEEDSLNSCLSLLPRPPKRDFVRFMQLDRAGLDGRVLRFLAKLELTTLDPTGISEQRRFIISYFLADGTVSVYEQSSKNTGKFPYHNAKSFPYVSDAVVIFKSTEHVG